MIGQRIGDGWRHTTKETFPSWLLLLGTKVRVLSSVERPQKWEVFWVAWPLLSSRQVSTWGALSTVT